MRSWTTENTSTGVSLPVGKNHEFLGTDRSTTAVGLRGRRGINLVPNGERCFLIDALTPFRTMQNQTTSWEYCVVIAVSTLDVRTHLLVEGRGRCACGRTFQGKCMPMCQMLDRLAGFAGSESRYLLRVPLPKKNVISANAACASFDACESDSHNEGWRGGCTHTQKHK